MGFWADFQDKFTTAFIEGDRWKLYLNGVLATLELTVFALVLGIVLGIIVSLVRTAHDQQRPGQHNVLLGIANGICKIYTTVIRGTPMLVQLLIWRFVILSTVRDYTLVGALGLGLNSGAYVAEIFRGGLMGVDVGQTEAGRSLGLNYLDTMRFIVVPQAFKNVLPALGNEFITLLKDTSLVSAIGGAELVYSAQAVGAKTYEVMLPYLGIAVMYLVIVMVLTWLQGRLEARLRKSDRRDALRKRDRGHRPGPESGKE